MKVLKKKLQKMIIPAIIESQSLPGFVTNESSRFLGKLLQSNSTPAYSMDNLLSLLNSVFRAMKAYYLEDSIITQTITELLKLVGVTAFNDLLMRRNFLSWKRGLQINYNITRIEEWCKSHDMPEGTLQLEHLMVSHPGRCFENWANHYIASNQASSTQEGHPERHRNHSGHLLDVSIPMFLLYVSY
jgi:myosin-5